MRETEKIARIVNDGSVAEWLPRPDVGKHILCVDYHKLNKQILCQQFPLPDVNKQLEQLGSSKICTQQVVIFGYH